MAGGLASIAAIGGAVACAVAVALSWSPAERAWLNGEVRKALEQMAQRLRRLVGRLTAVRSAGTGAPDVTLAEASEMIDVINLGLSAGLSFDASLELYCGSRQTPLARGMARALLAWRIGIGSREEELTRAARLLDLRALESFAIAVTQALALGAPLVDTLAAQSREMRAAHRAEVERQIERTPVKLLIPTGTLILPALLLSIVGPLMAASGMW